MLKTYLQYSEGGNIYKDNARINKDEVPEILDKVKHILDKIQVKNYQQIGSAGIKETSGDIDILVDYAQLSDKEDADDGIKEAGEKLLQKLKAEFMYLNPIYTKGLGEVSILVPIKDKLVQVDFILSNFEWGKQYHKREFINTKYSATDRGVAIAELVRTLTNKKIIEGTPEQPITWEELIVSPNKGIMLVTKTFKNEAGKIVKTARTLTKKQITKNFSDIAKMVKAKYKIGVPENAFDSFENIMALIEKFRNKELKDRINKLTAKPITEDVIVKSKPKKESHKQPAKSGKREASFAFEDAIVHSLNTGSLLKKAPEDVQKTALYASNEIKHLMKGKYRRAIKTGGKSVKVSSFWSATSGKNVDTSKTDIIFGDDCRISVKYGPSQLMSAAPKETIATFLAAADKMDPRIKSNLKSIIQNFNQLAGTLTVPIGTDAFRKDKALQKQYKNAFNKFKKIQSAQKELLSDIHIIFNKKPELKLHMVHEALSGEVKFGGDGDISGVANYILVGSKKQNVSSFNTLTTYAYAKKIVDKVHIDVNFKSGGSKIIDKIKHRPAWNVFRMIINEDIAIPDNIQSDYWMEFVNTFDVENENYVKSFVSEEEQNQLHNEKSIIQLGIEKILQLIHKFIAWITRLVSQGIDAIVTKFLGIHITVDQNVEEFEFPL
jgi:hypothetical protein